MSGFSGRLLVLLVLAVVSWAALSIQPAPLARADDVGVFVVPSVVEINLAAGESSSQLITVSNIARHPVQVNSFVVDLAGEAGLSATEWIKLEPSRFLMAGFEEITVEVTAQVPDQDLDSGGRYALVGFEVKSVDSTQDFGVTDAQSDLPVVVNVQGRQPLTRLAEVTEFLPVLEPNGLIGFNLRLTNTGNLHFSTEGAVQVIGPQGEVPENPAFPVAELALPGEQLSYTAEPGLALTAGETYTARASISFGGDQPVTKEISFADRPSLILKELQVKAGPDEERQFVMLLVNEGDLALRPRMQASVRSQRGETMGARLTGGPNLLLPGATGEMTFSLSGRLEPGNHIFIAEVYYGATGRLSSELGFITGDAPPRDETTTQTSNQPQATPVDGGTTLWWIPVVAVLGGLLLLGITGRRWLKQIFGWANS
ncbi:MAG: hypothetical protein BZY81_03070 [SAR202 cluster bacterium Io17-Chloro-G4]|nr:MAG: hypothetical protein BZY81_03070 [SAR202 cluster bacterium Io17-Chloro-G4]